MAHDSDEEQFEDALEEKLHSPLPITRVERVDAEPSHGEVPGTEAHEMRKQDAQPDEFAIIPDSKNEPKPPTSPIPKTVVEKVDPSGQSHGEVPGTEAFKMRQADAAPDEIKQAPETSIQGPLDSPGHADNAEDESVHEADDTPADDFDEFNEGDDDDDFGAFDEGEEHDEDEDDLASTEPQPLPHVSADHDTSDLPDPLNFDDLDGHEDIKLALQAYEQHLYPNISHTPGEAPGGPKASFLNERSQSLWAQLVAPPPLQPPNWVKSRTRRLFLVSLGVPVDLDEILPASKQKKLVLPSIDLEHERDRAAANGSVSRLKQKNASSTSVNSSASRSERKHKGRPAAPEFDENSARLLCSTTHEALEQYTAEELRTHSKKLDELKKTASALLEFWLIKRDSVNGDKEAFEEVINNFVKHAKKSRT